MDQHKAERCPKCGCLIEPPEREGITQYHVMRWDELVKRGWTRIEAAEMVGFSRGGLYHAKDRFNKLNKTP